MKCTTILRAGCAASLICLLTGCGGEPAGDSASASGDSHIIGQQTGPDAQAMEPTQASRILVAYFTQADIVEEGMDAATHATPYANNTRTVAESIAQRLGADLFQIETERTYPQLHREASEIAEQEQKADGRPALTASVDGIDAYDVVFLGFPIWWYGEPMAVRSFIDAHDLTGKTIIPFATSMAVGIEDATQHLRELCPDSIVLDGLRLSTGTDGIGQEAADWADEHIE